MKRNKENFELFLANVATNTQLLELLRELKEITDEICDEIDQNDFPDAAVNWADFGCVDANFYTCYEGHWNFSVTIEEASPYCAKLLKHIYTEIYERWGYSVDVRSEW